MRLHRIPPSWRTISLLALLAVQPWVAAAQDATEDLSGFATEERAPSVALHHMIAASDPMAAEAGLAVLEAGGDFADGVIAHEGQWLGGETFVSFDVQAVRLLDRSGVKARLLSAD